MIQLLGNKLSLYFPSESKGRHLQLKQIEMTNEFAEEVAAKFGGATVTVATGYWQRPSTTHIVQERKQVVTVFVGDNRFLEAVEFFQLAAKEVKSVMSQDAVSLEINGKLWLV